MNHYYDDNWHSRINSQTDSDVCVHGRTHVESYGTGYQYFDPIPFDYETYPDVVDDCIDYVYTTTLHPNWMIALYWHDIDMRIGDGQVLYRETVDPDILQQAKTDIERLDRAGTFQPQWAFVITFVDVTFFYGQHYGTPVSAISKILFIYLFGVLRRLQHCIGHIMTGSWKGRGNQYFQFVRVLYCKLLNNDKQLPAFPLEAMPGTEPRPQRWEARVLPLCHRGPCHKLGDVFSVRFVCK